jgi:hypothetical protein
MESMESLGIPWNPIESLGINGIFLNQYQKLVDRVSENHM